MEDVGPFMRDEEWGWDIFGWVVGQVGMDRKIIWTDEDGSEWVKVGAD